MKEELIKFIEEYGETCGNHCGLTAASLSYRLKLPFEEVRVALNELFVEKRIVVRDGAHGKLVFFNYDSKEEM